VLLERMTRQMKQQKVPSGNVYEHLMVAVERVETSLDELRVSVWAIPDRETYNPKTHRTQLFPSKSFRAKNYPRFYVSKFGRSFGRNLLQPFICLYHERCLIAMSRCYLVVIWDLF
jgi:hypothetical protein